MERRDWIVVGMITAILVMFEVIGSHHPRGVTVFLDGFFHFVGINNWHVN
ncbi:hypothetical protein [Alicyclobacillus fastidiosus]|uniref:Uncharacterized protein n=1 Tax=Alicyclobacillus fastidiosus TaxID=392011 RepID=A0ABV5AAH3_9BACL|nr:hypothetical protein [Alicyclobacillus fastidiosus]WEH07606.1 hypothetical protein PYS47_12575 [Alicyclobacillus fastidiosus]